MLYKVTHLWGRPKGEGHRKEKVLPDYDMVVIGSGSTGPTATLSALEATEKAGQVGGVALIEEGLSNLKYWRKLADETPNAVKFMLDQGIKLIRYDGERCPGV